ncbi:MAG TPA: polysaccharide biosynthesis protein [Bacillota bacterium]|jgi:stage V sporulation protein B|nr:polysaccharide biosynthesis protein [Bacillota bacterium]HOL10124.1 polysaccharide biosynthesis protein [Bacillota bacterium]HPO97880.1 polysaccharide biosynthesis protein [Bacillota bacterium]
MRHTPSIVKGTAILTAAGFLIKICGAIYRIFLSRMIGPEGIGLYQMAYPVYLIFLSLSTAGIPIAISKIVAEKVTIGDRAGIKGVFNGALTLLFGLGVTFSIGMAVSGNWVATHLVADPRAVYAIWALAPAIFFMSIMAVFRGFFQGWMDMKPSAYSQMFEQVVRVAVSLILASLLLKNGIEHAAAGAAFGATAGGLSGLSYLIYKYFKIRPALRIYNKDSKKSSVWSEIKRLVKFALPISIAVILMPLLQTLDSILVPNLLQKVGYTIQQSTTMLGLLGNSWAVIYLPLIVTGAIAANLVPVIAAVRTSNNKVLLEKKIVEGLRLALIYLIPATVGLFTFGTTIYRIIYGQAGVALLSWFAPAVLFLGVEQVTAAVLQGLGKPKWPLLTFIAGALVKIIVTVFTTKLPGLNLAGAALGTVVGAGITALLNLIKIKTLLNYQLPNKLALFISGGIMFLGCRILQRKILLAPIGQLLLLGMIGLLLYIIALVLLGGISNQDLELFHGFLRKKGKTI